MEQRRQELLQREEAATQAARRVAAVAQQRQAERLRRAAHLDELRKQHKKLERENARPENQQGPGAFHRLYTVARGPGVLSG
eukprot:jgi/Botrbrau1/3284/Bobra.174_1s0049.1